MNNRLFSLLSFVAAGALTIGCFHLPIGYYTFLRIVVFAVAIVGLFVAHKSDCVYGMIINGIIAALFNPFIPVYLHETVWVVLDLVSAIWFLLLGIEMFKSCRKGKREGYDKYS